MSKAASAQELLKRLIPPAQEAFARLQACKRKVIWGDNQITLRVRQYPKSKDERVSLVMPQWHKVHLYSEVLDRKVPLTMTNSTLRMIEDMGGLDSYLLKTPESKLKSDTASALKWEVLTTLRRKRYLEWVAKNGSPK
ncbi:hypothetical protein VOLCADRAFT_120673 [Volvox carteri f. nagariensis]|uniref:Mitochondrial ribosomal protein L28 n=1 Tax=Volvox carteri f. nagariensis TaxID=3068 RepID=D8TQZ3_VOLCA|nr:uncharacterized protein VOLCADRAFT_120673 [Volvox carteri f. nagariensis]EFJ50246.1 hypothetical protein VOLCADRAFT_120673 [Volvox carteri f. nagariensis]|eukprot:XP_002948866.1 hypothetical protein VOLCADRAFT_120673 [Volvox carteri f. nagariensis]